MGRGAAPEMSTAQSATGHGAVVCGPRTGPSTPGPGAGGRGTASSTREFHSPQAGQRPAHRGGGRAACPTPVHRPRVCPWPAGYGAGVTAGDDATAAGAGASGGSDDGSRTGAAAGPADAQVLGPAPASSTGGGCRPSTVRKTSSSLSTSTMIVSPARNSFHRMRSDSGSSTNCWMARRSGRAPSVGS